MDAHKLGKPGAQVEAICRSTVRAAARRCINVAIAGIEAAVRPPPGSNAQAAFLRASLALMLSTSARGVAANSVFV